MARGDLDRFFLVRDHLPDSQIIHYLEVMRGKGRDDFPVRAMWNALIAGIVFQHASVESLIRELSRNPALFEACGFDVLPRQKKPTAELVRDPDTGLSILDENGFPQGGEKMVQLNLEHHFLMNGPFRVILFADACNVYSEEQSIDFSQSLAVDCLTSTSSPRPPR